MGAACYEGSPQTLTYLIGGLYMGIGVLQALSPLWRESLEERIWHRYRGQPPELAAISGRVDAMITP